MHCSRRVLLDKARKTYYEGSESALHDAGELLTDQQYDALEYALNHNTGTETGYMPPSGLKVRLPATMPSLKKIKTPEHLEKWMRKRPDDDTYLVTPKLDGVAFLAMVIETRLVKLYTRGNGIFGRDITPLYLAGLMPDMESSFPLAWTGHSHARSCSSGNGSAPPPAYLVRGELVVAYDRKHADTDTRRLVSGFVNSGVDRANADVGKRIRAVVHELVWPDHRAPFPISPPDWWAAGRHHLAFRVVDAILLTTFPRRERVRDVARVEIRQCQSAGCTTQDLVQASLDVMAAAAFPVDGAVIEHIPQDGEDTRDHDVIAKPILALLNNFDYRNDCDVDAFLSALEDVLAAQPIKRSVKKPDYKIAYKGSNYAPVERTVVIELHWRAASTGLVIPRLLVEGVVLMGRNVSAVAGHNARYILDNGIGPGTSLSLKLGGGIVPTIDTLRSRHPDMAQMPSMDEFGELRWQGVHLQLDAGSEKISRLRALGFFKRLAVVKHVTRKRFSTLWERSKSLEGCLSCIHAGTETWKLAAWKHMRCELATGGPALLMYASGVFKRGIGLSKLVAVVDALTPDVGFAERLERRASARNTNEDVREGLEHFHRLLLDSPSLDALLA